MERALMARPQIGRALASAVRRHEFPGMTKIRVNYDGWLALPEAVRRELGLATGDRLDIELVEGAIILRPAGRAGTVGLPAEERQPAIPPAEVAAPAVRRGPGRPRKTPVAAAPAPRLKARGRRAASPAVPVAG